MKRALYVAGWCRALPTSLLGLTLAVLGGARPYKLRPLGVLQFVAFPNWSLWELFFCKSGMDAISIGFVSIFQDIAADELETVRHERTHALQAMYLGPFFVPVYCASCVAAWAKGERPYRDCWMEKQAYKHQLTPDKWG